MRAIFNLTIWFVCLTGGAMAQTPLELGQPAAAFAGGPIRLSKAAVAALRQHFPGDKVPVIPQPFRGKLDTALTGRDWPRVEAVKKELIAARGLESALLWEQTRFIATGGIGIAELHARDIAATGATGLTEAAAMLWLYAAAVTLTDGHKCGDPAAKDAHLDRLRGPDFDAVTRIIRAMPEDRLTAMRDLAIRLETVLASDRSDDTMCRDGTSAPEIKPDAVWKPEASATRAMLPRHLQALCAVMRPKPVAARSGLTEVKQPAKAEPPKPEPVRTLASPRQAQWELRVFDPGEMNLLPPEPAKP